VGLKVRYLHADIDAVERVEILRQLRAATVDVLVGINLLREGLDLPEVSLVCILDADKEGFLRNETSLIQTAGRAARHSDPEHPGAAKHQRPPPTDGIQHPARHHPAPCAGPCSRSSANRAGGKRRPRTDLAGPMSSRPPSSNSNERHGLNPDDAQRKR
jgi:hypothetical protein